MRARFVVLSVALFLSACGGQDPVSSLPADSVSVEPAAKVFSAPAAATCERCAPKEQASISLNYVRVHATASNPTGVVGATDVILGTYTVHLPAGAVVQAFGLYSRLDGSGFALADVFQNLQQIDTFGHVIGETIGTLGAPDVQQHNDTAGYGLGSHLDLGEPPYVFVPTPDYGLDNISRFYEIWVYADIKSDVSDEALNYVNGLEGGVVTPVVSVRLPNGRRQIIYLENGLQRVHIVQHGSVNIELFGVRSPTSEDNVLEVGIVAGPGEDVEFSWLAFLIIVRDADGKLVREPRGVREVSLFSRGKVLSRATPTAAVDDLHHGGISGVVQFNLGNWMTVLAGAEWEGVLRAEMEGSEPGDIIQFGVSYNLNQDADSLVPAGMFRGVASARQIIPSIFGHNHDWLVVGRDLVPSAEPTE